MTLWNIIRDFFVQYIFGGTVSSESQYGDNLVGYFAGDYFTTTDLNVYKDGEWTICLGDWLSTTATIITLIIICVLLGFFVRWLFRLTAGLIRGC